MSERVWQIRGGWPGQMTLLRSKLFSERSSREEAWSEIHRDWPCWWGVWQTSWRVVVCVLVRLRCVGECGRRRLVFFFWSHVEESLCAVPSSETD